MSLSAKLFIFIFSFFIIANVVCSVTDDASMQGSPGLISDVEGVVNINPMNPTWYSHIGNAFTWDYSVFKNADQTPNDWSYIKYFFLYPLSAAVTIAIAFMILPALISAIGSVFRWFI